MPNRPAGQFDVVVIGAGVLGTFHSYFAAKRGLKTLLIEQGILPTEASVRNFGAVIPSGMPPGIWHRRGRQSIDIYRQVARETGLRLNKAGTLYVAHTPSEADVLDEFARMAPELGYNCQRLDASEILNRNPVLRPEYCRSGLHFPDELRIESPTIFSTLIPWMSENLGCTYLPRTVATHVDVEGESCCVKTASGNQFVAKHVFVCTGSDLRTLLPDVYANSGLEYCKLQMMRVVPPAGFRMPVGVFSGLSIRRYPSFRLCDSSARFEDDPVDPELDRRGIHVIIVQDADGSLVIGDSHTYSSGPPDETLDEATESLIFEYARTMIDLPSWEVSRRWCGVYTQPREKDVYLETISERIHVVTGIGGKGMTTGPALAREMIANVA